MTREDGDGEDAGARKTWAHVEGSGPGEDHSSAKDSCEDQRHGAGLLSMSVDRRGNHVRAHAPKWRELDELGSEVNDERPADDGTKGGEPRRVARQQPPLP